ISEVLEIFNSRHDRGWFNFPGFFVEGRIGHGFSGGPVFWNGRLCGVASGVLFDKTYVASLWPFGLMEIKKPGSVERLTDWFDDWADVKNRISLRLDDGGAYFADIDLA